MNQPNFVRFKKERDLGSIISDTFTFLRYEWKPFFTTIVKISIIPILLAVVAVLFYTSTFSDFFSGFATYNGSTYGDTADNFGVMFGSAVLFVICYLIAYAMITVSAMYYIKSYVDNNGTIDYNYINQMAKSKFWSFVGLFFLNALITGIGTVLCFLPGIYFWVVLSLSSSILVFYNKGTFDAISDAFSFIKGHWWDTFGILLVITILVAVMNYITNVPAMIYQLIKMGTVLGTNDPTQVMDVFKDPIYLLLTAFSYLVSFFMYSITLISTVFVFFDINEQENASGSIDMIDNLGS